MKKIDRLDKIQRDRVESDSIQLKCEDLGSRMDIHKNGVLYLKEIV